MADTADDIDEGCCPRCGCPDTGEIRGRRPRRWSSAFTTGGNETVSRRMECRACSAKWTETEQLEEITTRRR